jgi:hypothetical protein
MKQRIRKYEDISTADFLVQRDALGLKRYKKKAKRDPEERQILLAIGLKKIKEREESDFIVVGYRKRRLII